MNMWCAIAILGESAAMLDVSGTEESSRPPSSPAPSLAKTGTN